MTTNKFRAINLFDGIGILNNLEKNLFTLDDG